MKQKSALKIRKSFFFLLLYIISRNDSFFIHSIFQGRVEIMWVKTLETISFSLYRKKNNTSLLHFNTCTWELHPYCIIYIYCLHMANSDELFTFPPNHFTNNNNNNNKSSVENQLPFQKKSEMFFLDGIVSFTYQFTYIYSVAAHKKCDHLDLSYTQSVVVWLSVTLYNELPFWLNFFSLFRL